MNLKSLGSRVFYGWWIVALGSIIIAVGNGIFYYGFTTFFLPLKRDLDVSRAAISLVYGAARLEGGAEGPVVGYLIDRFGARRVIIIGALLAGVGLILLATVHSFWAFFFIYVFIVALGYNAGFFHPIYALVNTWFIRHRALGFSIVSACGNVGGMVIAPVLSFLILNFGWRTGSVVAGLALLAVAIPCALPLQRSPEALGLTPDGRPQAKEPTKNSTTEGFSYIEVDFTVKEALRTKTYWLLASGITMRLFVTVALSVHFIPVLVWKGMDEQTGAYLVSLFAFSSIFMALGMGWLADRWNKIWVSSLGILPLAGAMGWIVLSSSTMSLYALPIGFSMAMGTAPINWALIGDFFGRRSYATLRGIMGVLYGFATFLSPIYAGWIHDSTQSYAIVLLTFLASLILSFFLFTLLPQPSELRKKKTEAPA